MPSLYLIGVGNVSPPLFPVDPIARRSMDYLAHKKSRPDKIEPTLLTNKQRIQNKEVRSKNRCYRTACDFFLLTSFSFLLPLPFPTCTGVADALDLPGGCAIWGVFALVAAEERHVVAHLELDPEIRRD